MPNHVINEIIFDRPASEHGAILAAACNNGGKVDFEVLIPIPAQIWRGNAGSKDIAAFGEQNCGIYWARANWGTKWNAYSVMPVEAGHAALTLRFQTAWSPPYPWLVALFNTCGGFRHNWLDEGQSNSFTGKFQASGERGESWEELEADEALHRHLHKLLWGVEQFDETENEQ